MVNSFKKTIIIIIPWFGNFSGGAEYLAKYLAKQFTQIGIKCLIYTTCSKSPNDSWWENYYKPGTYHEEGLEVHRFSTNHDKEKYENSVTKIIKNIPLNYEEKTNFFVSGINSDDLVGSLKKFVNNKNYEIIALPYFQGLTHSVINSYPRLISMIPCFHKEPQFYWEQVGDLLENSKKIFFNSIDEKEMTLDQYSKLLGGKIRKSKVCGLGVSTGKSLIYEPYEIGIKNFFVYVGRKDRAKNILTLCNWFEYYKNNSKNDDCLVFVGGGDDSLIPKNKYFINLGYLSEGTKNTIIKKSKALINLSENESLSIVLYEAWLNEKPVIVSNRCSVTRNSTRLAQAGLYPDNELEFELSLKLINENSDVANRLGKNGRKYVLNNFTNEKVLNKYIGSLR